MGDLLKVNCISHPLLRDSSLDSPFMQGVNMASQVRFAIPERQIDNTGITFSRRVKGTNHGQIRVRQNFIDWRPSRNKFVFEVSWEAFAAFAEDNGKRKRPKTTFVRARKKLK